MHKLSGSTFVLRRYSSITASLNANCPFPFFSPHTCFNSSLSSPPSFLSHLFSTLSSPLLLSLPSFPLFCPSSLLCSPPPSLFLPLLFPDCLPGHSSMNKLNEPDSGRSSPSHSFPDLGQQREESVREGLIPAAGPRLKVHKSARLRQRPKFRGNVSPDPGEGVGPARPPGSCEVAHRAQVQLG